MYVLLQIVGRPGWWLLLFFIPVINVVVGFVVCLDAAKAFGKGIGWAAGLFFLAFVFWPMIGFGSARYRGTPN